MNWNIQDNQGQTALHYAVKAHTQSEVLKWIVAHQATLNLDVNANVKDNEGQTPPHYLCSYPKNAEKLALFLQLTRVDVNVKDNKGETPLFKALSTLSTANEEVVRMLLKNGANVHIRSNTDESLIDIARRNKFSEITICLLEKAEAIQHSPRFSQQDLSAASESLEGKKITLRQGYSK